MLKATHSNVILISDNCDLRSIVAREGSELAERLRARGWLARSGWLSTQPRSHHVWLIRFECPSPSPDEPAA